MEALLLAIQRDPLRGRGKTLDGEDENPATKTRGIICHQWPPDHDASANISNSGFTLPPPVRLPTTPLLLLLTARRRAAVGAVRADE